ncbi:CHAT domain-containing protein, partial [bacterium]|nr:CHAT domain-containing protein [bacterium]
MPIDLVIRPSISDHDLKVLTRLRQEFDRKLERREPLAPKEIIALGTHLWEALANAVDGGLEKILALQQQAIASGTHVRLILESGEPDMQALPWEMTFHADQRLGFLSRNADFTLLRRWQPADEAMPDLPGGPLRILLFVASPEDLDPEKSRLDFETEQNFLFDQLDAGLSRGEVEIDVAEDGTLETLQARLESNVYHVVHCSMHGSMQDGHALLSFEDRATGRQRNVAPQDLIAAWKNGKAPAPCFFLSACQSALPDTQRAVPSFAHALLEAGVPHVLGMRRSVADTAATNFAGYFYHALAAGKPLDRAVTEARQKITGAASGAAKAPHELFIEVFQQWSIPVLYSRKPEPALLDGHKPFQPQPRLLQKKVQIGELAFTHEGFIGRRAAIRRHYRKWAAAQTPHLLLYGMGGVGKTALAGHFSLRLRRENPALQIFAFAPPFDLAAIEEQLRLPFLQAANKNQLENWQILDQPFDRLEVMLGALAARPTLFIFDNLESCLDLATRRFLPEHAATEALIAATQRLSGAVWTLLTCRYAIVSDKLKNAAAAELPEASLGDILRFMRQWSWPETVTAEDKKAMYKTLGGNFRSIEWLSGLLTAAEETWARLQQKFVGLQPPAGTPAAATQTVLEAMRRDLVFDELLTLLTPAEKVLLQRLTLEPRPLIIDGLYALWDETDNLETAITHLNNYALLESAHAPHLALATYQIPPLVAELLSREPLTEALQRDTHARLGRYWRFAGEKFTRLISDDLAAFEHFTLAGLQEEADEMLEGLSGAFYRGQQFGRVVDWLLPYVQRRGETTPWWALNRLGLSFDSLAQYQTALQCYLLAERLVKHPKSKEEKRQLGTTLNNISQVFKARGDYG